jgi:ferrochelatase
MPFTGPAPSDDLPRCTGILLTNLGTPDDCTTQAVRHYLKEFLSDPRVVELPRPLWWLILHGVILRTRPKRSAQAYRKVWTDQGSPLLHYSQAIADGLDALLNASDEHPMKVVLAMRYGKPSIAEGLEALRQANARRVLVLPLYPQFSATTTASTFDQIAAVLRGWRWLPELRFINHYPDNGDYIRALADSVRRFWRQQGTPDRLLISFHGIPQDYADAGDPYDRECKKTGELLARALGLEEPQWGLSFQSRMGTKQWLKPYTDETLKRWASQGVRHVQVICPGFPADCLETLEEIGQENRDYFLQAGGEEYHYIPALNSDEQHIQALANLARQHDWPPSLGR